jgi:adenosylcobinamide-phosphate synthase
LNTINWAAWSLPLGVALDATLGDPEGWPHPVRAIGWLIRAGEELARKRLARLRDGRRLERFVGIFLALGVLGLTGGAAWTLVWCCDQLGGAASLLGRALLVYWGLAARDLGDAAQAVATAPDLEGSRRALARLVGRDTAGLERAEVDRACVESVAENTNDAVVAPLFWYALAGPVGMWVYKAINTLDSMLGYRNARYERLGWTSARLDDFAGLVPARITWLLVAASAVLIGERGGAALRIGWRDGRKHPSPNAAWGEAAMAGALGVQLGGWATYAGVPSLKPILGDTAGPLGTRTIHRAVRLLLVTAAVAAALAWAFRVGLVGAA